MVKDKLNFIGVLKKCISKVTPTLNLNQLHKERVSIVLTYD
jgi:hypothetical protein